MDNGILNNLQIGRGKWFSDLVDENMISNAMLTRPYEVTRVISYVFGSKDDGYSTSLDAITGGLGNVMSIDKRDYEWNVMIDTDRAVTIRSAKWNGLSARSSSCICIRFCRFFYLCRCPGRITEKLVYQPFSQIPRRGVYRS